MKADLRIFIKDYHRNKNLEIQLVRVPFTGFIRVNSCLIGCSVTLPWRLGG